MDRVWTNQRINKLLDKYWECATSVEEERELRRFFSSAVIPPDLLPYKAWFVSHEPRHCLPWGKILMLVYWNRSRKIEN